MFRFHQQNDSPLNDLVILGGGAAAVCTLVALTRQMRQQLPDGVSPRISIAILERATTAGNGFPYDPALQHHVLRVNNPNYGMIVDLHDPLNFVNWIKRRGDQLKREIPALAQMIDDHISGKDLYASRMLFGKYLQERLVEAIADAKQLGIDVRIETNANVVDVIQDAEQNWYFKTENHGTFSGKNLVIAAGHLPSAKFPALMQRPGYFNSPYTDLTAIPDAPVFVLGTGLSGIDTVKTLAAQQHRAPVYMISPSGQLPRVKGPLGAVKYQMKYLTRDNLDKPNLRLSEAWHWFTAEMKHAMNRPDWTEDTVMQLARQTDDDPLQTLKDEIACVEANQTRGWQLMLSQIWFEALILFWKNVDDRDREEFLRDYFPLFLKWNAGMPLINAKQLANLMTNGNLHVIKAHDAVIYNEAEQSFQITTADDRTITAATVINATGIGVNIHDNPTLYAMAKRGLIRAASFRGGIDMNANAQVINANGQPHDNAFAIGVIALKHDLGASSIEMTAHNAKNLAPKIMRNLLRDKVELTRSLAKAN